MSMVIAGAGGGAAALSCTAGSGSQWINESNGDFWAIDTTFGNNSQYVVYSGSVDLCRVDILMDYTASSSVNMEICDTDCATNCTVSGDTATLTTGTNWYTFNFPTNPNKKSDFKVCFKKTSASAVNIRSASVATYFGTATVGKNLKRSGSDQTADYDIKIYYLQ
jgi:hypothetical protein